MLKHARTLVSQATLAAAALFVLACVPGCQDETAGVAPRETKPVAPATLRTTPAAHVEHPVATTGEHPTATAAEHPPAASSEHATAKHAEHPKTASPEHPRAVATEHPATKAPEHPRAVIPTPASAPNERVDPAREVTPIAKIAPAPAVAPAVQKPAAVSKPIVITDADFNDKIEEGIVLVDFWADWCGWCHRQAPILNTLAGEYAGKIVIGKIDTDRYPEAARRFGIRGLPTMILFKDGRRLATLEGFRPEPALRQTFDAAIAGTLRE
jgi:thioredoxin 1